MQIAHEADELFNVRDGSGFGFERFVLSDERVDFFLRLGGENFLHAREAEFFHVRTGFAGVPSIERRELHLERSPIGFGQFVLVAEQRFDGIVEQVNDSGGVRGIDAGLERQRFARGDLREREAGDFADVNGQIFTRNGGVFRFRAIERGHSPRIKRGEAAATEIIVHLGFDGFHRSAGGGGSGTGGQRVRITFAAPIGKRSAFGEERIGFGLVNAGLAAAVVHRAETISDVRDDGLDRCVAGRFGDDHAVAVEGGVRKNFIRIARIGEGDGRGVLLAEVGENLLCGSEQRSIRDVCERDAIAAFHERVGILELRAGPFDGGDEFVGADAFVAIRVNERGGLGAEFNACRRTGERDPKFLVELIEVHEVSAGFEFDLIESASAEEFPCVCHRFYSEWWFLRF